MKCSICSKEIEKLTDDKGKVIWDKGHNAQPVNNGRCCDGCNWGVVIRQRLVEIKNITKN